MIPSRRRAVVACFLALGAGAILPRPARAHDPALHGIRLVRFARPFPAPAFVLSDLQGADVALAQHRGRHVLLNFWATWCPPCLQEMPSMDTLYQRYREAGLTVLAISSDQEGASQVQPFIDRLGVSFPILLDPTGAVSATYGAKNLPTSFLLDPEGRVVAAAQGALDWASAETIEYVGEVLAGQ